MAQKTNSFERFWKELKRRKVVHVITVYAATAFVILELVNMVARPLKLPDWTEAFVIVLLCIGFVIAIFLSWVYDITPAGVKKTKPVSAIKHSNQATHAVSGRWKIATYVSVVVIIALVAFNFINKRNLNVNISKLEKSIAVLPFINDSPSDSNQYFINGIMEEVLNNLQKIKDFRVLSRTSTTQYTETNRPTIPEIAKKLGVNYIVEGSGQKYGNKFVLRVQLLAGKNESHLWAKSYDREIQQTTDIISVHREIAQLIASELKTTITPEEKQIIEKIPTSSMTAYDLCLKANNYLKEYEKNRDVSSYQTAVNLYNAAISIDSAFAKAYTGLAKIYYDRYFYENYFKEGFLDSCLFLVNKALSIDGKLDEAYYIKGLYYDENGDVKEASDNYDKALKINPNYYLAYVAKGGTWISSDFVGSITNYQKALNLISGNERPSLLKNLALIYLDIGFVDNAKLYYEEALNLDGDSANYFNNLAQIEFSLENFKDAILFKEKASKIDSKYFALEIYSFTGQHQKAYKNAIKAIELLNKSGELPLQYAHRIGYAFSKVGKFKEADYYFKEQIKYGTESIKLGRGMASLKTAQFDLAAVYAFLGEKTKAYQYLDDFNTLNIYPSWWISYAKHDPMFGSIRNEERFQKILHNMEAKYQTEHERVRKWLEEQGML